MSVALTDKPTNVTQYLNSENIKKYLEGVLKDRAGQFITSLASLSNLTPGLSKCDPKTLMYCGLKAASLNMPLDNNLGFAYAIPYGGSAQFQMGYKGYVQLAQRTGQYKRINVIDVRMGELKKWDAFTEELEFEPIQDQDLREKAVVIGYAGMFELVNGYRKISYWTRERVEKHAKRFSKTYKNGPWQSDFDAMARKTVIKDLLSKWGPLSTEIMEAIKFDNSVIHKNADGTEHPEYVDASFEAVDDATPRNDDVAEEFRQMQEQKNGQLFGEGAENASAQQG